MNRPKMKKAVLGFVGLMIFFIIWQLAVDTGMISSRSLASPTEVLATFFDKFHDKNPDGGTLIEHFVASIKLALAGFSIAIIIGVPLGLFMGYFKKFDRLIMPIFELIRPIPAIAWIPIVILTLGIGFQAKAFIIFLSAFVPCVINSYLGIKLTNKTLMNVSQTFGASHWEIFTKVCIPSSMNMVFSGVRISLSNAWTTLVAAEMLASTKGLGYMIQMGRTFVRPDIIIVGMLSIGITGAILSYVLGLFEKKVAPWRYR